MEEIIRFVTLAQTDRFTLTDLCEQFGISRKTAYKHLERGAEECTASGTAATCWRGWAQWRCPKRTKSSRG